MAPCGLQAAGVDVQDGHVVMGSRRSVGLFEVTKGGRMVTAAIMDHRQRGLQADVVGIALQPASRFGDRLTALAIVEPGSIASHDCREI